MSMCGPIGDGRRDDEAFHARHGFDPRDRQPIDCSRCNPADFGPWSAGRPECDRCADDRRLAGEP